jgi:hypothetical protein
MISRHKIKYIFILLPFRAFGGMHIGYWWESQKEKDD